MLERFFFNWTRRSSGTPAGLAPRRLARRPPRNAFEITVSPLEDAP